MPVWTRQPLVAASASAEIQWLGESGLGATLATLLAGWRQLYFEVTEAAAITNDETAYADNDQFNSASDAVSDTWLYAPSLGIKHLQVDGFGNFMISEHQLRAAASRYSADLIGLNRELQNLLAAPWEEALEPLRAARFEIIPKEIDRAG
jgi:hypothetical protein